MLLGSFSNHDGNGKENVLGEKNSRFLKLLCECSNLLSLSDVTELSVHRKAFKFKKRKRKLTVVCSRSPCKTYI